MLVLSRKRGEKIILGGTIVVTVVEVVGNKVRLGFDAPKDIEIIRKELLDDDKDPNSRPA